MTKAEHESYGMLSISRVSANQGRPLFGSSLVQHNFITLKIGRASLDRDLSYDHYYPNDVLVEVDMSPIQFIDAMTNMNTAGIPCTIRRVGEDRMEDCPYRDVKDIFHDELKQDIQRVLGQTEKLMKLVEKKLRAPGTISKKTRLELADLLYKVEQDIRSNIPYVYSQFNNQMDKTVNEAKAEIEAFFTNTIHSLGSKELIRQMEEGKFTNPLLEE